MPVAEGKKKKSSIAAEGGLASSTVRSSFLRVAAVDPELRRDMATTHVLINEATAKLADFLFLAAGEPYYVRQGGDDVLIDQDELRDRLVRFSKTHHPGKVAGMLREFHDHLFASTFPRGYLAFLIRKTTRAGLSCRSEEGINPGLLIGRELHDMGLFPIFNEDEMPNIAWQSAWVSALAGIKSWREARKRLAELRESRVKDVEKYKAEIGFDDLGPQLQRYRDWLNHANQYSFAADPRFFSRWGRTLKRLRSTGVLDTLYDTRIFTPLLPGGPMAALWDNPGARDFLKEFGKLDNLQEMLAGLRPDAAYCRPDFRFSPVRPSLGFNYLPFEFKVYDERIAFSVSLISSADHSKIRKHSFSTWRSRYFQALEGGLVEDSSSHVHWVKYRTGNRERRVVEGTVKECSIAFNREYLERVTREDFLNGETGNIYIGFPVNVPCGFADPLFETRRVGLRGRDEPDYGPLMKATGYFQSSLLTDAEKHRPFIRYGMRAMAVDLGLRPLMGVTIYELQRKSNRPSGLLIPGSFEVPGVGVARQILETHLGDVSNPEFDQSIFAFRSRIRATRQLVVYLRGLDNQRVFKDLDWVERAFATLGMEPVHDVAGVYLAAFRAIQDCHSTFSELRAQPHRRTKPSVEQLGWILTLGEYLRLCKAWHYKRKPPMSFGERRLSRDFYNLTVYIANLKLNLIRKIAAEIRMTAMANGVHVVILEDMGTYISSMENERDVNGMLSAWSHRTIVQKVRQAVSPHGIHLIEDDPRLTSQVDSITDEFGFCSIESGMRRFFTQRNGEVVCLDADINASRNLQRRFWTRFRSVYSLDCRRVVFEDPSANGHAEAKGKKKATKARGKKAVDKAVGQAPGWLSDQTAARTVYVPDLESIRVRGGLEATYGSPWVILIPVEGGSWRPLPVTAHQHKELWARSVRPYARFYHHGDVWLDAEEHEITVKAIFQEYKEGERFEDRVD